MPWRIGPCANPRRRTIDARSNPPRIVDGAKVLMLTVTSPVFMQRLPKGSLRRLLGTKVLRQAHRILDMLL